LLKGTETFTDMPFNLGTSRVRFDFNCMEDRRRRGSLPDAHVPSQGWFARPHASCLLVPKQKTRQRELTGKTIKDGRQGV